MSNADADVDWDLVSFAVASEYRVDVIADLEVNGPSTTSAIAADTGNTQPQVSRALNDLSEEGIVETLVSEDRRKGRLYTLTEDGRAIVEEAKEAAR